MTTLKIRNETNTGWIEFPKFDPTLTLTAGSYLSGGGDLTTDRIFNFEPSLVSHTLLADIGTNTHADIDNHIAATDNPHNVTAAQVGKDTAQWNASKLQGYAIASTAPTDGYTLRWNAGASQWEPVQLQHSDLGGVGASDHHDYPVPTAGLADDAVTVDKLAHDIDASGIGFNAAKLGGYTASDFPRKAEAATISEAWTFQKDITADGGKFWGIGATVSTPVFATKQSADGWARHTVEAHGLHAWGPGDAAGDVDLYREGAGFLAVRAVQDGTCTRFAVRQTWGTLPSTGSETAKLLIYGWVSSSNEEYLQIRSMCQSDFQFLSVGSGTGAARPLVFGVGTEDFRIEATYAKFADEVRFEADDNFKVYKNGSNPAYQFSSGNFIAKTSDGISFYLGGSRKMLLTSDGNLYITGTLTENWSG